MSNLPLRTRKEAVAIGNRLLQEGYIQHLVDQVPVHRLAG